MLAAHYHTHTHTFLRWVRAPVFWWITGIGLIAAADHFCFDEFGYLAKRKRARRLVHQEPLTWLLRLICTRPNQNSVFYFLFRFFFRILFSVPPIIEPFSFQDGLAEGMRTRTVCGVSRGKFQSFHNLQRNWIKQISAVQWKWFQTNIHAYAAYGFYQFSYA